MTSLTTPDPGREAALRFVADHLAHLVCDDVVGSTSIRGGQQAADQALATLDISGYAANRNEVRPVSARGASKMSPYIRHGLLQLREVWDAVADAPSRDVRKYRDELMWQEFARHWYARLGPRTATGVRGELNATLGGSWQQGLACIDSVLDELHADGWLVNQTRMWLASHWALRQGDTWQEGEDDFFRHLLDGSRAANRLGWQWTSGVGSAKPYGFSRWQVEKRAPELCGLCAHQRSCPVQDWPADRPIVWVEEPAALREPVDQDVEAGPAAVEAIGSPEAVWITAESLGDADPALVANPSRPAIFVFDESLLARLQLSSKRLVFLTESLSDLATRREVELHLGDPRPVLAERPLAATFAPVPGFRSIAADLRIVETHPWPWLTRPAGGSIRSFSAWRKQQRL